MEEDRVSKKIVLWLVALALIVPMIAAPTAEAKSKWSGGGGGASEFSGNAYGYTDTSPYPYALTGATITANYWVRYGILTYEWSKSTTTDSSGNFHLSLPSAIPYYYDYIIWNYGVTLSCSKAGHWTDYDVFYSYYGKTFKCVQDKPVYAPLFLSFSNTDDASFRFTQSISLGVRVASYLGGSGYDVSLGITMTTSMYSTAGQLQVFDKIMSTGVYHLDHTTWERVVDKAWCYGRPVERIVDGSEANYHLHDTMSPPSTVTPVTYGPNRGGEDVINLWASGSVRWGYKVSIGVSYGVSISVDMEQFIEITADASYELAWGIYNGDPVNSHSYKVYLETTPTYGLVLHIWKIT